MHDIDPVAIDTLSHEPDIKYIVPGLKRGLDILKIFNRKRVQMNAPEIAKELQVPRSTIFRLLQTLEYMDLIEKVPNTSNYKLAAGALGLGFEFLASLEITDFANPILEKLSNRTGLSAHIVIRDKTDVVFIAKKSAKLTFSSSVNIGTRLPAHGTVLGRVLLADLSKAELKKLYPESDLVGFSKQTPESVDKLSQVLELDRVNGYAISEAYFENGIGSIAAAIRDGSSKAIAAINVIYQLGTVEESVINGLLLESVLAAAEELSRQLNYSDQKALRNVG